MENTTNYSSLTIPDYFGLLIKDGIIVRMLESGCDAIRETQKEINQYFSDDLLIGQAFGL